MNWTNNDVDEHRCVFVWRRDQCAFSPNSVMKTFGRWHITSEVGFVFGVNEPIDISESHRFPAINLSFTERGRIISPITLWFGASGVLKNCHLHLFYSLLWCFKKCGEGFPQFMKEKKTNRCVMRLEKLLHKFTSLKNALNIYIYGNWSLESIAIKHVVNITAVFWHNNDWKTQFCIVL